MATSCRLIVLLIVAATILCNCLSYGGPVRSYALAAQRASKIPRSIRAPFKNMEMMTARGFGKRNGFQLHNCRNNLCISRNFGKRTQLTSDTNDVAIDYFNQMLTSESNSQTGDMPWSINGLGRKELGDNSKLYNEIIPSDAADQIDEIYNNEQTAESFPIDWLANEMASNPSLAHAILRRFVDTNKNGILTTKEILGGSSSLAASVSGLQQQQQLPQSQLQQQQSDANDIFLN